MTKRQKNVATQPVDPNKSEYPDLAVSLELLQQRIGENDGEKKLLLEKWYSQLHKVQGEINHLKKIEALENALNG